MTDARFRQLQHALGHARDLHFTRAPGRVNLIGDHTDYQDGWCLPVAIDRDVVVGSRARDDCVVSVQSLDLGGNVQVAADGTTDPGTVSPEWGRAIAAVVRVLATRGRAPVGIDAAVASNVPVGSGLSSSAAFEVAVALALCDAASFSLGARDLALASQEAEHLASGVPCGVMDQMASVFGRAGHGLLLDCRSLDVTPIELPPSVEIVVVHSGLPRALASSAYAERRAACESAAARLGVRALRDATFEQVANDPIPRHVVSENRRVLVFADALTRGDVDSCGRLMLDSHASLRDDFGVSTQELDLLVDLLVDAGALGARLTGAGFGGCVVALALRAAGTACAELAAARYGAATGLAPSAFAVHAVDGAETIEPGT